MDEGSTSVGMDVHKERIRVAMMRAGEREPVEWQVVNEAGALRRLGKKLIRESGGEVECCYEAGPCGYAVQRELEHTGVRCMVVAPALTPVKPGERIKTDRRDARKLAELLRAGVLTEVHPPNQEEEAVRDLCRCREDIREDLLRSRHRLTKMLLRRGLVFRAGRPWTRAHRQWLGSLQLEHDAERVVYEDYLLAVEQLEARLAAIDGTLEEAAQREPYARGVGWLRCFRGIDTITALTLVAELHDFRRFASARSLMAYLGLVPSEYSSSDRVRRGSITKTGNGHVRRVLIEAAWHYRHRPGVGSPLAARRQGQPGRVTAIADRAQVRLHRRYGRLVLGLGKPKGKAVTAIARELVGFIWAVLHEPVIAGAAPSTS
jgi:transposase